MDKKSVNFVVTGAAGTVTRIHSVAGVKPQVSPVSRVCIAFSLSVTMHVESTINIWCLCHDETRASDRCVLHTHTHTHTQARTHALTHAQVGKKIKVRMATGLRLQRCKNGAFSEM